MKVLGMHHAEQRVEYLHIYFSSACAFAVAFVGMFEILLLLVVFFSCVVFFFCPCLHAKFLEKFGCVTLSSASKICFCLVWRCALCAFAVGMFAHELK